MKKRITLYTNKKDKAILIKAAKKCNLSLSSYIRLVSIEVTKNNLNEIELNNESWESLVSELNNPNHPNGFLIDLFKK